MTSCSPVEVHWRSGGNNCCFFAGCLIVLHFDSEVGDSTFLRNFDKLLPIYMVSYPRRQHFFIVRLLNVAGTTKWLTAVEQRHSWEADSRSRTQEILLTLWNPKFHYYVHKNSQHWTWKSEINLHIHMLFFKIHFNIILTPVIFLCRDCKLYL
jgi:hypothetical protein